MYNDDNAKKEKPEKEIEEKNSKNIRRSQGLLVQATLLALVPADRLPKTARAGFGSALGPIAGPGHLR
jgi:hypothetical protein